MFYSQSILGRRGKFGIIWMEATGVRKQTRRQLFSVNIRKACFDILDYVLVRLPPMEGGKKRPRFSLYLSAQLMYGTVRVFGRQHDYLLADAVAFKSRVRLEIATAEEINLAHVPRPEQVNIPDAAAEAGEKQAGFDPFFGVWKDWDESDVSFKEDAWLRSPSTPEREELSQLLSPSAPSGSVKPEFGSPYTVSSIEEITIKDVPVSRKLLEVEIPGEKDIPQFDGRELEMIQEEAQGEGAMMDLLDLMPDQGSQSSQSDQVATLPTAEEPEGVLPRAEVTPKKGVTKKAGEPRRKRDRQQQDEGEKGEAVTPPKTARVDPDLSMELMPVEASPRQRRHRRQLFVDANIQLSKDDLRNQLATGYTTCGQFLVQTSKPSTPAELFARPGSTMLEKNKTLLRHWKKNLVAGISDTESDKERPIWSVPELGHSRRFGRVQRRGSLEEESFQVAEDQVKEMEPPAPLQLEERREEMSSIEVPREISMSKSLTPTAERSLSRHDISRESAKSAEESLGKRRSGAEPTVEKDVGLDRSRADDSLELKVVPEELSGMYSPQLSGAHDVSSDSSEGLTLRHNFFRRCERARGLQQYTTFREVCPTSMKRHHAAARFAALLELCKEEKLFVKQRHPYSEIYISSRKDGLPQ